MIIRKSSIASPLNSEENARLSELLFSLGKSETGSQLMLINGFKEFIKLRENAYRESYLKNSKLYIALGVFCGVVLGLIVI